jgi:hypothetical protein
MWSTSSKILKFTAGFMVTAVLTGCATIETQKIGRDEMFQTAVREGFKKQYLSAPPFVLTAYHKRSGASDTLVVYIEGDGYAWVSRTMLSDDPTPKHPLAFFLASEDRSPNVLYLARPGQFLVVGSPQVDQVYWTSKRYSEEVIQSTNAAIDQIKRSSGASKVSMIGYSGGAAVAVLVAARRNDVVALRTVAGNLAPEVFNREHHLSPLSGSLNPVAVAPAVQGISQRHFIGREDVIVTKAVTEAFLDAEGDVSHKSITEVDGADHLNGWAGRWNEFLAMSLR